MWSDLYKHVQSLLKLYDTELQTYIYILTVAEVIVESGLSLMFGGVSQVFIWLQNVELFGCLARDQQIFLSL